MISLALCHPAYGGPWGYVANPFWEFAKEHKLYFGLVTTVGTICGFPLAEVSIKTSAEEIDPLMASYVYPEKWRAFFASPEEIRDYISYISYLECKKWLPKNSLVPKDLPGWDLAEEILQELRKLEICDGSSLSFKDLPTLIDKYDEKNKKNSEEEISSPPPPLTHLRQFVTVIAPLHLENIPLSSLDQTSIMALFLVGDSLSLILEEGSLYKAYKEQRWAAAKNKILFSLKIGLFCLGGGISFLGLSKALSSLLKTAQENKLSVATTGAFVFLASLFLNDLFIKRRLEQELLYKKNFTHPGKWSSFWASPQTIQDYMYYWLYNSWKLQIGAHLEQIKEKKNSFFNWSEEILKDLEALEIPTRAPLSLKNLPTFIREYEEKNKNKLEKDSNSENNSLKNLKEFLIFFAPLRLKNCSIPLDQSSILALLLTMDTSYQEGMPSRFFPLYKQRRWDIAIDKVFRSVAVTLFLSPLLVWGGKKATDLGRSLASKVSFGIGY